VAVLFLFTAPPPQQSLISLPLTILNAIFRNVFEAAIKLLEKGSTLGYPMIIAKAFQSFLESVGVDLKLKVSDNGRS